MRIAFAAVLSALLVAAAAADYPDRPIKLIVPFAAGAGTDAVARFTAQKLEEQLKQPVVVENRVGASGAIGTQAVAQAPADGYTLLLSTTGIESVNPFLFAKMPYDPGKDLAHVAALGRIQLFLVTKPSLPVKDTKEFVAFAKANPGKLSYGSAGAGSTPHLAGELFKQQAGFYATHIPYRGAAPALQDLLASQLDYYFDPGISFPHVRTGKLKMLAVASNKRSALFPDVPTLGEVGYKGVEADTWFGIYAPAGVPAEVIARLNRDINKALAVASVNVRFLDVGGEATPMSPAEFKGIAQAETKVFSALIKERGIKME